MREIKFRCLDKKSNTIIQWEYLLEYSKMDGFLNEDFIFMQYTGLKDKNGKEIYDWDVIEGIFRKNIEGKKDLYVGKVIWYHNGFYISFGFEDDLKIPLYNISAQTIMIDNYLDKFTIIGNIYEHPNLLTNQL